MLLFSVMSTFLGWFYFGVQKGSTGLVALFRETRQYLPGFPFSLHQ